MKVLLIIPAYNEEESIESTVRNVITHGYDYIVVNDGSKDRTLEICRENAFHVLDLRQNLGIGGAVQAGHKYALENGYDVDVQFDGDGQHDIECVEDLLEGVTSGADVVVGSRFVSDKSEFRSSPLRRLGIRWLELMLLLSVRIKISDSTSGFRACGRRAIELFAEDYPADYPEPESLALASAKGLKIVEVPVVMHERQGGVSSISGLGSVYYMVKVSGAVLISGISKGR